MQKVVAIGGPTAAGKTSLGIKLAKKYSGEIISVDSTQVYRGLNIGTGKDLSFPQKMIDIIDPETPYSITDFTNRALKEIDKLNQNNILPILVGGTGYYLDALLYDKSFPSVSNPELVQALEHLETADLIKRLMRKDPISAKRVDGNRMRIIRALEIIETTKKAVPLQSRNERFEICLVVLDPGVEEVDDLIVARIEDQLKEGLIEEVRSLKKIVDNVWLTTRAGLEYESVFDYLENKLSYNQMKTKLISATQAYARRQRTWFRRYKNANWIINPQDSISIVNDFLSSKK